LKHVVFTRKTRTITIHIPLHIKFNALSVVGIRHHTDLSQHTNHDTTPDEYESKGSLSVHIQNTKHSSDATRIQWNSHTCHNYSSFCDK